MILQKGGPPAGGTVFLEKAVAAEEAVHKIGLAVLACMDHEDTVRLLKGKGINMVSA